MYINSISNVQFEARIKVNKSKLEEKILKSAGSSMIGGASSSLLSGTSSGGDMVVHLSNSAVPAMQNSSGLFDQFAHYGHKFLNLFFKNYMHNGYDASFFSLSSNGLGVGAYSHGMNTLVKGIEKEYANKKIPT